MMDMPLLNLPGAQSTFDGLYCCKRHLQIEYAAGMSVIYEEIVALESNLTSAFHNPVPSALLSAIT